MNRRSFLRLQIWGALCAASGLFPLRLPKLVAAGTRPDIAAAKGSPADATRAAVQALGGMREFVKPGRRVVIKPNMSFASPPERASNTHPEVVRELAAMCKEAGAAKVLVLDHTLGEEEACLEKSGIRSLCKSVDQEMVYALSDDSLYKEVAIPHAKSMNRAEVMKEVLKSDVLIAAPVAKSHSSTGVSLSMKGMMGLVYNRSVMHWRYDLNTAIVDLCTLLKPHLVVVDATRVLSTNGPGGPGKVLHEKLVIASRDMVAADAYAVSRFEWYGKRFKPRQVAHLKQAHERGLGRMDVENLDVKEIDL